MKIYKTKDEAYAANVDKTVQNLLERALVHGATDLHIEPRTRNIAVRFRVDGWLQEVAKLPLPALDAIAENLKKRAGLDANVSDAPQRGSFVFDSEQLETTVQLATMPTIAGENLTMHLSRPLGEAATLSDLGFWGDGLHAIESAIAEPHGLVISASPNHTGATLSLLGMIHLLNSPTLNITTLEETVEHRVPGINHTQLNAAAGINYSTGLKALLNQDPNIVMVSDLHEAEAVRIAVQASLGGRLILGGVHAADTARGVSHVLTLSREPFLVASSLRLAVAQRFVRKLCGHCREAYVPDEASRKALRNLLKTSGINSVKGLHALEKKAIEAGLGDRAASTNEKAITRLFKAATEGCPQCRFSGYQGRIGICEVLPIASSDTMQKLIASGGSTTDIRNQAVKNGMVPLPLDGLTKALRGLTSLEEILPLTLGV